VCVLSGAPNPFINSGALNSFTNFDLDLGHIIDVCDHIGLTIAGHTIVGGERAVRELMKILGITARAIVKMARAHTGTLGGRHPSSPAREIAEDVKGRKAWDIYKNLEYKAMTGSRRPTGRAAVDKLVKARNKKNGRFYVWMVLGV